MRRSILFIAGVTVLLEAFAAVPAAAQPGPAGRWEGILSVPGAELRMVLVVTPDGPGYKATMDSPQQGALGLVLRNVQFDGVKAHFELPAGATVAIFDGTWQGYSMSGNFEQAGTKGTFEMKRGGAPVVPPTPPPPYKQEEVKYQSGAVTLACTLTLPESNGPHPAAVMITGSGPQDRDERVAGFRIFGVIADHLTRRGIAVLRCDDRGVGGSSGSVPQSTAADLADDALAGVRFLQARPEIDKTHVGLIGHSEGGLVAPMLAARTREVAFIVLLAGPGLSGEQIMLAQSALIVQAEGLPIEQARRNQEIQRKMFAAVRTGTGWDEVAMLMRPGIQATIDALQEAQRKALGNTEKIIQSAINDEIAGMRTPSFKFFLDFDPATALEKIKCPVLAIFGGHDVQVAAAPNRAAMEKAFAKGGVENHRIEVFPTANHLFQDSPTGTATEYPKLKKEFVPGLLDLLSTWIGDQAGIKR